ncbi:hypothetical protein Acj9p013 [Acinetobacter phage Acj9]|uniref:Uncharacterized protein n=1 Tax=Acinetobacter phage Acj9 TaxID=760939 RepID=E5EPE7_9CAUD|nr:hypothetical protein Acj9p013 [Acinetobacter phage Acj9]ADG59913.1 hypothetical protein Acj9p013 [Acinetobacter phage Acj9]
MNMSDIARALGITSSKRRQEEKRDRMRMVDIHRRAARSAASSTTNFYTSPLAHVSHDTGTSSTSCDTSSASSTSCD